jgi:hypothetical protein
VDRDSGEKDMGRLAEKRKGRGRGKLDMGGVGKGKIGVEVAVLLPFVRRNELVWEGERWVLGEKEEKEVEGRKDERKGIEAEGRKEERKGIEVDGRGG